MLHDRPTVSSACVGTIFVLPVIIVMSDSESPTASERFHISKCMCLLAASQQCFGHVCLMLFFIQDVTSAASSDAEDEASVAAHVKWLAAEFKRTRRNAGGITDRMARTYADRRRMIDEHTLDVVLTKYIFLRDPQEVHLIKPGYVSACTRISGCIATVQGRWPVGRGI